jgi:AraC-like DNA-binding protein
MVLQEYKPSLAVSDYVRTFRLVHYDYKADGSLPMKAYPPRPEHCLSFYARDFETVEYQNSGTRTGNLSTVLFGHQTEVTNRFVGNNFLLIQVVFKPGGLFRLTGIPSDCLTNQYIDAQTVFSNEIKFINDRINECKSFPQMIQVVETFLLHEIKQNSTSIHSVDTVTSNLFRDNFIPSVDDLAESSCQSIRSFERHFKQRMGVSPKYFLKVLRFENAFRMRNKNPLLDWFTIAISCGYYDYQHLARDYKDLSGSTPNQFHEIDLNGPERLFGEADIY